MKRSFRDKGGGWVLMQFTLMASVLILGPIEPGRDANGFMSLVSTFLLVAGAGVGIAGFSRLGASRTAFPRPTDESRLVTDGIYGFVRHPLYLSLILLAAGWACLWRSMWTGLAGIALAVLLEFKSRVEERWLRERFVGYADYARRVRRLVPWIY